MSTRVYPSEQAILRHDSNPPCYHFLFTVCTDTEVQSFFWNPVLGIRRAGGWFACEVVNKTH